MSECELCDEATATLHCAECDQDLCAGCDKDLHRPAKMQTHKRNAIGAAAPPPPAAAAPPTPAAATTSGADGPKCGKCMNGTATARCTDCDMVLCSKCNVDVHKASWAKTHKRAPLNGVATPAPAANKYSTMPTPAAAPAKPAVQAAQTLPAAVSAAGGGGSDVVCELCDENNSTLHCGECDQDLCDGCDKDLHKPAKMASHKRSPIGGSSATPPAAAAAAPTPAKPAPPPAKPVAAPATAAAAGGSDETCELCDEEPATLQCGDCDQVFCAGCDGDMHKPAKMQSHKRTAMGGAVASAPAPVAAPPAVVAKPAPAPQPVRPATPPAEPEPVRAPTPQPVAAAPVVVAPPEPVAQQPAQQQQPQQQAPAQPIYAPPQPQYQPPPPQQQPYMPQQYAVQPPPTHHAQPTHIQHQQSQHMQQHYASPPPPQQQQQYQPYMPQPLPPLDIPLPHADISSVTNIVNEIRHKLQSIELKQSELTGVLSPTRKFSVINSLNQTLKQHDINTVALNQSHQMQMQMQAPPMSNDAYASSQMSAAEDAELSSLLSNKIDELIQSRLSVRSAAAGVVNGHNNSNGNTTNAAAIAAATTDSTSDGTPHQHQHVHRHHRSHSRSHNGHRHQHRSRSRGAHRHRPQTAILIDDNDSDDVNDSVTAINTVDAMHNDFKRLAERSMLVSPSRATQPDNTMIVNVAARHRHSQMLVLEDLNDTQPNVTHRPQSAKPSKSRGTAATTTSRAQRVDAWVNHNSKDYTDHSSTSKVTEQPAELKHSYSRAPATAAPAARSSLSVIDTNALLHRYRQEAQREAQRMADKSIRRQVREQARLSQSQSVLPQQYTLSSHVQPAYASTQPSTPQQALNVYSQYMTDRSPQPAGVAYGQPMQQMYTTQPVSPQQYAYAAQHAAYRSASLPNLHDSAPVVYEQPAMYAMPPVTPTHQQAVRSHQRSNSTYVMPAATHMMQQQMAYQSYAPPLPQQSYYPASQQGIQYAPAPPTAYHQPLAYGSPQSYGQPMYVQQPTYAYTQ